jgi:acyl carrier protein
MSAKLFAVIAEVMQVDAGELDELSGQDTVTLWDSAREVDLAFALERAYGIAVDDEEINALHSVAQIRTILAAKGVAAE